MKANDIDGAARYHHLLSENTIFLPREYIIKGCFTVTIAFLILECLHFIFRIIIFQRDEGSKKGQTRSGGGAKGSAIEGEEEEESSSLTGSKDATQTPTTTTTPTPTKDQLAKTASQMTHLFANIVLATFGCYFWFFVRTNTFFNNLHPPDFEERVLGNEHLSFFGWLLISYNAWSSYCGWMVWGGESTLMTIHHIMASIAGFLCSFTNFGFRYYSPFFCGVIELSSLPLSILNAFEVRKDWIQSMPVLHAAVKASFAVTFLAVRAGLWGIHMTDFLRDTWTVVSSNMFYPTVRILTAFGFFFPGLFLSGLQLFWVTLVLKGLMEMITDSADGVVVCTKKKGGKEE